MQQIQDLIELLDTALHDPQELGQDEFAIIKEGYDEQIDELRNIVYNSKKWLGQYQAKLIEETGITSLKIKFTQVSGYFIEVSKNASTKIPNNFIIKQTLVGGNRYTTIELQDFEQKLFSGETQLLQREREVFEQVTENVLQYYAQVKEKSSRLAYLDFLSSLAKVAHKYNYKKPEIHTHDTLEILGGRHPIIETLEKDFVSNDLALNQKDFIHIITGPNMGGKSTYLRQNALMILMAHIGSFVPARTAKIPLTDKIFSRVGAQDNLMMGQSTFMVEMQEVANILHNSTKKSFIIIDEVGRGTSTYDGMSLAWAILKYLHDVKEVKTLFATHYHELVDESKKLKYVSNYSVAVGENSENLIFLRKVVPGAMKQSFGLEVAAIAGIPRAVLSEAREMLKNLETIHTGAIQFQLALGTGVNARVEYIEKQSEIEQQIKGIDLNTMTPLEAMTQIQKWKNTLRS